MRVLVTLAAALLLAAAPQAPDDKPKESLKTEFAKLKSAAEKIQSDFSAAYTKAKTEEEREALSDKYQEQFEREGVPLVEKALTLATPHAREADAVEVLTWVINYRPGSPLAAKAADLLAQHHLKDEQTIQLARRFSHAPFPWTDKLFRTLLQADLPRDKQGQIKLSLAESLRSKAEAPAAFKDLDEKTLRQVEKSYGKEYIEQMRSADAAKLNAEAAGLYEELAAKYGDVTYYGKKTLADAAKGALFEMNHLAIGKEAPDIEGEDIDGKAFKLSDYRGKVVVLDFWGHW
jgi:AhpC/TSA family